MIDTPFDDAVRKITQETGLVQEEVQRRIDEKMIQLSGLVSKDGAVHILANELGVQLLAIPKEERQLKINEITLSTRNLRVTGKVIKKYDAKTFNKNGREGRVASLLLGDETGITRLVFWNDQVDVFLELKENDILVVANPFVKQSYLQDRIELQLNTQSTLTVNPEGVSVTSRASSAPVERVQKYIKDLDGTEESVELIATIVTVYDPRFFDSCPQCNRKVLAQNQCPQHGEVTPGVNFSMSAFLDDGTGNIRTNFWKQQALRLTGKTEQEFLSYKDDPTTFEQIKNDLLGEFVKVIGKAKKNEAFDRFEFTANLVFTDVDPTKELENLEKKFQNSRQQPMPLSKNNSTEIPITSKSDGLNVVEDDVISLDELEKLEE